MNGSLILSRILLIFSGSRAGEARIFLDQKSIPWGVRG